jgi:hypothetical protein
MSIKISTQNLHLLHTHMASELFADLLAPQIVRPSFFKGGQGGFSRPDKRQIPLDPPLRKGEVRGDLFGVFLQPNTENIQRGNVG